MKKQNPDKSYSRSDVTRFVNERVYVTLDYVQLMNPDIEIEDEVWKDLPGHEFIQVSSWGNVRRKSHTTSYYRKDCPNLITRYLPSINYSIRANEEGYLTCIFDHNTSKSCHRLVAEVFLEIPDDSFYEVDHIDFNPNNCYYKNLQCVSPEFNQQRSHDHVLKSNSRPVVEFRTGKRYSSISDAIKEYGITLEQSFHLSKNKFLGYIRKLDLLFKYESELNKCWNEFTEDERIDELMKARLYTIRKHRAKGVLCTTTRKFYPTAQYAAKVLNIPEGAIYESIQKYDGNYKKLGLHFEYVNLLDIDDSIILSYLDHYLDTFSKMSGGVGKYEKAILV